VRVEAQRVVARIASTARPRYLGGLGLEAVREVGADREGDRDLQRSSKSLLRTTPWS
jgi:hypothetical protein